MKKQILFILWTLGSAVMSQAALTWSFSGSPRQNITDAMNTAVGNFNRLANYSGNIVVTFNPGVPTAQTDGYQGLIEFGGSISARVAEHEIAHWLGCGTYWDWNNHRSNGQWTGANAMAREKSYDGAGAVVFCDAQHFWPYGWNQDNEGPADRHIGMVGALRHDMGLSDTTIGQAAGSYRLQNRADGQMLDNLGSTADGANVAQWPGGGSPNQRWVNSYLGSGYFKLSCVTGGKYLDTLGHTANGSTIGQWGNGGSFNQQWTIVPTDSGYFKITNRANGKCLDTGGQTGNGAAMQNWPGGGSWNQQWRFVQ
jgi:Ricin-type beta-trefoil lectin domain-like